MSHKFQALDDRQSLVWIPQLTRNGGFMCGSQQFTSKVREAPPFHLQLLTISVKAYWYFSEWHCPSGTDRSISQSIFEWCKPKLHVSIFFFFFWVGRKEDMRKNCWICKSLQQIYADTARSGQCWDGPGESKEGRTKSYLGFICLGALQAAGSSVWRTLPWANATDIALFCIIETLSDSCCCWSLLQQWTKLLQEI